jgi:hypothetical protein
VASARSTCRSLAAAGSSSELFVKDFPDVC